MIELGLIIARFLHYAAITTLAGASLFPLYAYADAEPWPLSRRRNSVLLAAAAVVLFSWVLWFVFAAANMSGTLADIADREMLWTVLHDTGFGEVWMARTLLAVIVVAVILTRVSTAGARKDLITPILSAALLASLAGVGHSQIEDGRAGAIHIASDAVHLLAAGAWLGGLVPLGHLLLRGQAHGTSSTTDLDQVLFRFSGMGYIAVATLAGSGLVNGWFLVGSVSSLFATPYGQLLVAKLAIFAGMSALAAANRFWLVRSITKARSDGGSGAAWSTKLRNHVLGEQLLGLVLLLIVSILGTMRPAIGQQ
jgi:putative copper resistance protein D